MALGSQPPRVRQAPARRGEVSLRVVLASERCGQPLDTWQADVIHDSMSVDAVTGRWLTPRVAVSVPRQNGKGAIIEALELAFLLGAFPEARVMIHSAHEYKTAQSGFERIKSFFDTHPTLVRMVDAGRVKIGTAPAREYIRVDGRTLRFLARSKGSGRGFSADLIILDEAQELPEQAWSAMLPTISARPNAQVWLFGTPPDPTMNGEVFSRMRDNALAGTNERLAYFEWSATPDDDPGDPATWRKANPALDVRITEETVRDEYNDLDAEAFGRERLGMWDGVASLSVIPEDAWAALVSDLDPAGRVVFAIDVNPDQSRASIGVAGRLEDGRIHVQAIENRRGTAWVVPRLAELTKRWSNFRAVVVDTGGTASALLPDLKAARIRRVKMLNAVDVRQACAGFYTAAMGDPGGVEDSDGNLSEPSPPTLAHPDQPILNDALFAARKRPLGDGWAWQRKDTDADITPIVAVTFAAYVAAMKPERSQKRAVVM